MAKICIFNTAEVQDSAGGPFQSDVPIPPAAAGRTKPARLLNAAKCAFEFIFTGAAGQVFLLYWWMEFWGDDVRSSLQAPPLERVIPTIPANVPWSREVLEQFDAGYLVCNKIVRKTQFNVPLVGGPGDAIWVPVSVHAPWVRLAVYTEAPGLNNGNLLINAHIGGHHEDKFLTATGNFPYAYNG